MTDQTVAATVPTAVDGPTAPGRLRSVGRRVGAVTAVLPAVLTDGAVLAFALWTLLYHAALPLGLAPSSTFRIWLVTCVVSVLLAPPLRWWWRRRAGRPAPDSGTLEAADTDRGTGTEPAGEPPGRPPVAPRRWTVPVLFFGVVAAITAGLAGTPAGDGLSWWVPASAGAVAAVGAVLLTRRTWRVTPATRPPTPAPTAAQSAYALLVSGLVAVASLLIARNTPDDVYYVGRSVWVAQRDVVPLNDFLFSENVLPAMASLPPTASIEVFAGALGRFLDIHAASATWYVLLPVLAVLAVLALWRVVQQWAPRRPVLAFTVAIAFLGLVAGPDAALGTFHLPRLYEGKGMFVSAVVPLMWYYLTRWFDDRSPRILVLIVALSVTAIGLSTTAAIILPMLVGGAALMMTLVGRWKAALVAGVAAVAYPVGAVIVTQLVLGQGTATGADAIVYDAEYTYRRTFEVGIVGVIGGLALWCGPLLVRRRTPALLAAGGTLTLSVLLVPGVLEWLAALTGISVVLWRVPWLLALPALVGLLCTVWLPTGLRAVRALVGVALAGVMVASFAAYATPMWSERSWVEVHDRPTWKLPQHRQSIVFWIDGLDRPDGFLLAPDTIMRTTPIVTSEMRVVLPRDFYLVEYDLTSQFAKDRLLLTRFASGAPADERPTPEEVAGALERVDVGTICVYGGNRYARQTAGELGYVEFASRRVPGRSGIVVCLRRV
ncbi:DUF6077 domain-containing protein [Micromonospora sp. NPDC002389]|uniref:DUF6077 domain-containing protein n=1 Tax=Micromonospora sp. NPDC002389 TaxID=3154272 RepID=UPI003331E634